VLSERSAAEAYDVKTEKADAVPNLLLKPKGPKDKSEEHGRKQRPRHMPEKRPTHPLHNEAATPVPGEKKQGLRRAPGVTVGVAGYTPRQNYSCHEKPAGPRDADRQSFELLFNIG
jgi:hypothetical protein